MDHQLLIVLALLAGVLFAFLRGKPSPEWAAVAAFAALPFLGVIEFGEALNVFTHQAPIIIAMMFVMSAALERTGCVEILGDHVSRLAGRSYLKALLLLMGAAMASSAMMNNTPVVIIMVPLAMALAQSVGVSASRLLMPLSFAAILGGSMTLLGASANVLVSDGAVAAGARPFGMFEMTGPGLIFAATGMLYMVLVGRYLLPDRRPGSRSPQRLGLVRQIRAALRLATRRPATAAAVAAHAVPMLRRVSEGGAGRPTGGGLVRRKAPPARDPVSRAAFEESDQAPYRYRKAPVAVAIAAAVMLLAGSGALPIMTVALLGAMAAVLTGCVTLKEAAQAVDWKLVLMIFGMLGLSLGLEKTGAIAMLAEALIGAGKTLTPVMALLLLYAMTSLLTETVTNNAVALMMAPVAMAFAEQMGVDPRAFLMAVMFAASASFATPIGYQTNMIVYRAAGYRFHDFLVVGLPLNILFAFMATLVLPWFFPF